MPELEDYTWPNTHPKFNWCHQIKGVRTILILHLFVRILLMLSLNG